MNLQHEINLFLATDKFQIIEHYTKSPFLPCMMKQTWKNLTPHGFDATWRFWKIIKDLSPEEFKYVYERIKNNKDNINALKEATTIGYGSAVRCLWCELGKQNFTKLRVDIPK